MEQRNQFTFYSSFYEAIRRLKKADRLSAYDAIIAYALEGVELPMTGAAEGIFVLVKPTLDAARRKSEGRNNRDNSQPDENKTPARPAQDTGKTPARPAQDTGKEKEREKEYEYKKESYTSTPAPKSQDVHKFGEYGRVRLTAEQYDRLLAELGQAELERCIRYVDELAQSTENKNKWKDWNLVVRRCSREGWGRHQQQNPFPAYNRGKGIQPEPGDLKQPVKMEMGEAERRAIEKLRSQKKEETP